jgi:hypothetical protein
MGQHMPGLIERLGIGQSLRRWKRALQGADALPATELREMEREMRAMRARLDTLGAEARKALLRRAGVPHPPNGDADCDWIERPAPWDCAMHPRGFVNLESPTHLPGGITLYHDATRSDLSLRQDKAPVAMGNARFGLVLEVYRFDGSFVSLVHDLPDAAIAGLTLNHYIAVDIAAEREHPVEVYVRLNVQHGPNVEQMVRQVDFQADRGRAEFDLAYTKINERRIEKAWLDIIIEGPEMTRIALWDVVVMRAPRADI